MQLQQQQPVREILEQEYLEGERVSQIKHELIDAQPRAMAGASANHGRISSNILVAFLIHLQQIDSPCEPFQADMKVKAGSNFFYPDVLISCDEEENDYFRNSPLLIVEVVSRSTRKRDNVLKRLSYQSLPSVQEYVLIEQDFIDVEVCRRTDHWQPVHYYLGDEVYFASIEFRMPVEEIYARVMNDEMSVFRENKAA